MKAAVYFGSRDIYYDMVSAYKSLLVNSDVDKIYLLIEDDEFPFELHPAVQTVNIRDTVMKLFSTLSPNFGSRWTYIGLIRGALPKLFPQYDRILSIDCDTVVLKDMSDLWDIDFGDNYVAGVREPILSQQRGHLYINAGVIMLNLAKMREDGIDDALIEALNTKYYCFVAQDAINDLCMNRILEIPGNYNVSAYTDHGDSSGVRVQHFAGGCPHNWRELDIVRYYRALNPADIRQGRR